MAFLNKKTPPKAGFGVASILCYGAAMDLFAAMFAKGLIFTAWAAWEEWRDHRKDKLLLNEERGGDYACAQPLLQLPAPENPAELADSVRALE